MKIQDQNFLITGANRGIGLAVAKMAAREGALVHLVVRQKDIKLEEELKALGAQEVKTWEADLSLRLKVDQLIENLKNEQIDILFNNAGVLTGGLLEEQDLNDIYTLTQVNIATVFHLTRALIPGMVLRKKGKIINNASVSAFMHFPCASTYAASKAAVVAFTNCISSELKDTGVTTLCLVTPGIKTRMFDEIEVKYSKNFEIPTDSITPDEYAQKIKKSIENDDKYYLPKGATGVGLFMARYLPQIFSRAVDKRFHR